MRLVIALLAAIPLLSACADPSRAPFEPEAAAFVHEHGEGAIEGHAFITNQLGMPVNAAGQRVYLYPATAYARERFSAIYRRERSVPAWMPDVYPADPRFRDYVVSTVADANGTFRFEELAPGAYIVSTKITWQPDNRLLPEGKQVYDLVVITGNETEPVRVIVAGT